MWMMAAGAHIWSEEKRCDFSLNRAAYLGPKIYYSCLFGAPGQAWLI